MNENSDKDGRGGARPGAGRKSVADELNKNTIIQRAVNAYYKTDLDDEGKQKLINDLLGFERGMMFIAEHLLGKPKEKIDVTSGDSPIQNFNLSKLSDAELSVILKLHAGQPINTDRESD